MEYTITKSENLAEIEVSYKTKVKASERPKITDAEDAVALLRRVFNPDRIEHCEEFVILLLNRAQKVLGWAKISQGGVYGTVIDPKVVFQIALNANACGIILAHNHPSGNTKPSPNDMQLTKRLIEGGKLLDISVLDHVIMTAEEHYSFANNGQMI